MLILARVCADFYDRKRNLIHRITQRDLGLFRDVPESIQQDPLFQMLVDDGSIKYPADAAKDRALEQDPYAGADATGKDIRPKVETKPEAETKLKAETKPKTTAKAPVKTEAKAEDKPAVKTAEIK